MTTAVMEKRAREIFRGTLFHHHVDEIPCGDEVELWLKTHGGWFPDQQQDYGYGCMMPESDGPDVMSKNFYKALKEAKGVMSLLAEFLEDADLKASARSWLEDWNVQDVGFRLEFRETLRGIHLNDGRDRSRSPRRSDDWDAKAAALQLDVKDARIQVLKEHIQSLETSVKDKDALIEKAKIDDVIQKANIDALGDVVKAKDDRIASLEWRLALKERTTEMLHEIISEHCRRASR